MRLAGTDGERHAGPAPASRRARAARSTSPCRSRSPRPARRGSPRTGRARARSDLSGRIVFMTLTVSSRSASALGGDRRLHREQADHVQQVVLHDVPQAADAVVERAAPLDAERLGHRHLHALARSGGSRPARAACWRSGTPSGSGRAPCRGSGRCGRSRPRRSACAAAR